MTIKLQIMLALANEGPLTSAQLTDKIGAKNSTVRARLAELGRVGSAWRQADGAWCTYPSAASGLPKTSEPGCEMIKTVSDVCPVTVLHERLGAKLIELDSHRKPSWWRTVTSRIVQKVQNLFIKRSIA